MIQKTEYELGGMDQDKPAVPPSRGQDLLDALNGFDPEFAEVLATEQEHQRCQKPN